MSDNYNWYCYKTVLPKKNFACVMETKQHVSFYKEGEPIVVLQKTHSFHPSYTKTILNRLHMTLAEFANLLALCKNQPP